MSIEKYNAAFSCKRLDLYLTGETKLSRSHIKKLIDEDKVTLNGKIAKASDQVKIGDEVFVVVEAAIVADLTPENLPLDIVYQDKDIAVINKAQGVTVHAGGGTKNGTLVNALLYHLDSLSGVNGVIRPGIVHRIDKDTSGLLVVAKNDEAHISLSKQIAEKTAHRVYVALLEGVLEKDGGTVKTFIARSEKDRKAMAVAPKGRIAVTDYEVIERFKSNTLARFTLHTGRTHQIRVHAKYLGHPIVGDKTYGYKKQRWNLNGQLLHAEKLVLVHPKTNEEMTFTAPIPDYFLKIIENLRRTEKV